MPNKNITEAEGITVVMRSLYGIQDETATPWYTSYYNLATQAGIVSNTNINTMNTTLLTREKLGTWFHAAAHLGDTTHSTNTQEGNTDNTLDDDTLEAIRIEQ